VKAGNLQASCEWAHNNYPEAKLFGTARHHSKLPSLPWQDGLLEDPHVQTQFQEDIDMRIPKGVVPSRVGWSSCAMRAAITVYP
jgi:hypothetical protein